jgi:molybdenum cofactor synthesis domain-containing protein
MRVTVMTVSSSAASGQAEDISGPRLLQIVCGSDLSGNGDDDDLTVELVVVADDQEAIERSLRAAIDDGSSLILTTGGTGFSTDDLTPEATLAVIDREAPGLAEAIRADAATRIPTGILTRGAAGISGRTLIINLPGSPKAVEESFSAVAHVLPHALAQLGGPGGRDRH